MWWVLERLQVHFINQPPTHQRPHHISSLRLLYQYDIRDQRYSRYQPALRSALQTTRWSLRLYPLNGHHLTSLHLVILMNRIQSMLTSSPRPRPLPTVSALSRNFRLDIIRRRWNLLRLPPSASAVLSYEQRLTMFRYF